MEPTSGRVLVLSPVYELNPQDVGAGDTGWLMVGRGWREPLARLIQTEPSITSRITVVTDSEDPDLDHGHRLGIRIRVRPDVVHQVAQNVRSLSTTQVANPVAPPKEGPTSSNPANPVETARTLAIDGMRRLLLANGLSRREAEVAAIAIEGYDNAGIAALLFLSPNTVKRHLSNAYRKLGVRHRAGLMILVHSKLPASGQ